MSYNLPNFNETGLDQVLVFVAREVPIFFPMFLVFIFAVTFLAGYNLQRFRENKGDEALWFLMAGVVTTSVSLALSTTDGIINLFTLVVVVTITLLAGLWYFNTRDRV